MVLIVATVVLLLGPVTISTPVLLTEALVLASGIVAMLVANAFLLRVGLDPLVRLTRAMATVDLRQPGHRLAVSGPAELSNLMHTFNSMLRRLEAERAASASLALSAQEEERARLARELHDEIGQTLTAVLLELKRVADQAPPPVRADLLSVQETTRNSLDEIRRIARHLRPGVLDELGLTSALKALAADFSVPGGLTVTYQLDPDLPGLDRETELVLYRVAQEGLTNTARHAHARRAHLTLRRAGGGVRLSITDDGQGLRGAGEGAGVRGMRERALLVGAKLALLTRPEGGTEVQLLVPARDRTDVGASGNPDANRSAATRPVAEGQK